MHIAVLITVYNRKAKTLRCLSDIYHQDGIEGFTIDVFVVDGGSIDGTPDAIRKQFPNVHVSVSEGLFWAGGMRRAWTEAMAFAQDYDFFWLLNDDTHLYKHALREALNAHSYAHKEYGKGGLYVGSTISPTLHTFTYGCRKLIKQGKSKAIKLIPNGEYQFGELANANIMMVSREVFDAIGGLCTYCTHGIADYDYSLRATNHGFPCLATPNYCGECEDDHGHSWKSVDIPLSERVKYLYSPKGLAYNEFMQYIKRFFPREVFVYHVKFWAKTLFPILWDKFKGDRYDA